MENLEKEKKEISLAGNNLEVQKWQKTLQQELEQQKQNYQMISTEQENLKSRQIELQKICIDYHLSFIVIFSIL